MLLLYAVTIFIATTQCDVLQNMKTFKALNPEDYASHHEQIDSGFNYLCSLYSSLRTSDVELIKIKKEFEEFIVEKAEIQDEVLDGFPTKYRALTGFFKKFRRIAKEEFEDLEEEEREIVPDVTSYMMYKLTVEATLKVITERKEDYKRRKLTKEQIKNEIEDRQNHIFVNWHRDGDIDEIFDNMERKLAEKFKEDL